MYDDNLFAVDTTGVQEMGGFEVFPAGLYPAMMVSAAKKPTKDGNGGFLECVYQIIDGEFNGKKFTSRLNLWNMNQQAVDIAKRELKSLRLALGLHDQEGRTSEFLNKPLVLNITVKPRKDKPDQAENNLIGIEAYTGAPAQVHAPMQQAPAGYAPNPGYAPQPHGVAVMGAVQQQQMPFGAPPQQPQQQPRPAPAAFQPTPGKMPWMTQ